jgi:OOP family OmpA-OmpF porin
MNRKRLFVFFLMVSVSLLTGCFQFQSRLFPHRENLDAEFQLGRYVPKIDNFFIILDASTSMSVSYKDEGAGSKFDVAKDFIKRMNNTMPEMNVNGSLLTFGRGIELPANQTETVYGPTTYSRSGLEQSLNSLNFAAEGNSPAGRAIKDVSGTIGSVKGYNAVILISDGEHLEGDPRGRVRIMEDHYGDRTCFYTVWIGNNSEGKAFMEELAGEIECGYTVSIDKTVTGEDMIDFVKQVFLTTDIGSERDIDSGGDSDGDGVPDSIDKCPDTPIGVEVDGFGCPKVIQTDNDGDGVFDDVDECPDTPVDAIVDDRGCWVVKGVQFDYKKWGVKPQFNSNLDNIENILKKNPGLKIRIEGHTDDIGSMKYNIDLSGKRAQAIKDYLVDEGIDPSRITTTGLGYAQPIADNDTPDGRALNRRAEIIPVK